MGQLKNSKIVVVIFCLLLTSLVMFWQGKAISRQLVKNASLAESLTCIGSWCNVGDITLSQGIVAELKLDDFLYRNFTNGRENLSLYIGYYNSQKKVGAAHDPLVCFPGQGWVLSDMKQDELTVKLGSQDVCISYSTMIAGRNSQRQVLVYWFQAYDQATSNTLSQKISLLQSKMLGNGGDNAFVRIGMLLEEGQTESDARETILSFVDSFYPIFYAYVKNEEAL